MPKAGSGLRTQAKPERTGDAPRSPLVLAWDYRWANAHLFATDAALRWFIRQNRAELLAAVALLRIGGRYFVDPPKFEQAMRAIGSRGVARVELRTDAATERQREPKVA